jgi:hypothetical protein
LVSTSIVHAIHRNGGRFIKFCPSRGIWIQVSDTVARIKVAQALKYRCRKWNARLQSPDGGSSTTEEHPSRPSPMLTKITAVATMELLRSSGVRPPRAPPLPPPPLVPRTPHQRTSSVATSPMPHLSSPPPSQRRVAAVTPYTPPGHRRIVDFRYPSHFLRGATSSFTPYTPPRNTTTLVYPSPVATTRLLTLNHRHGNNFPAPPVAGAEEEAKRDNDDDEDDVISISSIGNDAYVAESLTTLIRDYIAVPLLSASVTEEEGDPLSHPEIALVESRPNALQRSTAMYRRSSCPDKRPVHPNNISHCTYYCSVSQFPDSHSRVHCSDKFSFGSRAK